MSDFICPVCGACLTQAGGSLRCGAGHCYDLARQGYVNLLLRSQGDKRHGDDSAMVAARRAFLDTGLYEPVRQAVLSQTLPLLPDGGVVLDAGCGEGWYTQGLTRAAADAGRRVRVCGVDISRAAVKAAAARHCGAALAVASTARLPLADGSVDLVWNLFSPLETGEYARVLRPGGHLLRAIVGQRHLWELKAAVYDAPYENDVPDPALPGFALTNRRAVDATILLPDNQAIQNLFCMTPYYYKTAAQDRRKLDALEKLETRVQVWVLTYEKTE